MSHQRASVVSPPVDDESFIAMARPQGRKTPLEDMTFRSVSPGSPVAASTVARPVTKNNEYNER